MSESIKIAFAGAGMMGEALIGGILDAGVYKPGEILASDVSEERRKKMSDTYGIRVTPDTAELPSRSDTIVLAIKPQDIDYVLKDWKPAAAENHLIISIVAGIPSSFIEGRLKEGVRVIRVMPNTPSLLRMGCSGLAKGKAATEDDMKKALAVFEAVGTALEVKEQWMDAITALSGGGPAYLFLFAESLIEAGVRLGIPRPQSRILALQTIRGAAEMLLTTGEHPVVLRENVSSPGGTTLAALAELEKGSLHVPHHGSRQGGDGAFQRAGQGPVVTNRFSNGDES